MDMEISLKVNVLSGIVLSVIIYFFLFIFGL